MLVESVGKGMFRGCSSVAGMVSMTGFETEVVGRRRWKLGVAEVSIAWDDEKRVWWQMLLKMACWQRVMEKRAFVRYVGKRVADKWWY